MTAAGQFVTSGRTLGDFSAWDSGTKVVSPLQRDFQRKDTVRTSHLLPRPSQRPRGINTELSFSLNVQECLCIVQIFTRQLKTQKSKLEYELGSEHIYWGFCKCEQHLVPVEALRHTDNRKGEKGSYTALPSAGQMIILHLSVLYVEARNKVNNRRWWVLTAHPDTVLGGCWRRCFFWFHLTQTCSDQIFFLRLNNFHPESCCFHLTGDNWGVSVSSVEEPTTSTNVQTEAYKVTSFLLFQKKQ